MFKVLFIDEQQDEIDNFEDYVELRDAEGLFEVLSMFPLGNLDQMVENVICTHADAIVTDFMLNEFKEDINYNVPYDGAQLVQRIVSEREDFPCFVMTAFDLQAVDKSDDVNIVYVKAILHGIEDVIKAKANFLDRVKNQIMHYQARLKDAESRLLELIERNRHERLNAFEEEEMSRLDEFLEKALDKRASSPEIVKRRAESESIRALLTKVDDLARKLGESE